ncbi:MAG: GNAT family N-acetyltransferase [bacterium]|nr:GNAT family N-acetyltransferase [bacterium]
MSVILETERLRLRKLNSDDGSFILRLVNTEGWLKYIGNRGVATIEEAQLYLLTGPIDSYRKQGFGLYLVELKETSVPIGICGLVKRETLEHVDLGFAFLPDYVGNGYASEAARATLAYAKSQLGMKKIVAVTDLDNLRSINLLKKLGMEIEKKIRFPKEKKDLYLFSSPEGEN